MMIKKKKANDTETTTSSSKTKDIKEEILYSQRSEKIAYKDNNFIKIKNYPIKVEKPGKSSSKKIAIPSIIIEPEIINLNNALKKNDISDIQYSNKRIKTNNFFNIRKGETSPYDRNRKKIIDLNQNRQNLILMNDFNLSTENNIRINGNIKNTKLKYLIDSPDKTKTQQYSKNSVKNTEFNENQNIKLGTVLMKNYIFNKPKTNNILKMRNDIKNNKCQIKSNTNNSVILRQNKKIENNTNRISINSISFNKNKSSKTPNQIASNKSICINNKKIQIIKSKDNKSSFTLQREMKNSNNFYYNNTNNETLNNSFHINFKNIYENINNNQGILFIDIKLDDMILIEERLNDIYIALNKDNIKYDGGASNECIEFFASYFQSSLKYKLPLFFTDLCNRKITQLAINFLIFSIVLVYHLSKNISILQVIFRDLAEICNLLKINLYLIIKNVQIYYGNFRNSFIIQNDIYFKTFEYILKQNQISEKNELEISSRIQHNCINISANINKILAYYQDIGNIYYLDFYNIYNKISEITEKEINNYFYKHLYNQPATPLEKFKKIDKLDKKFSAKIPDIPDIFSFNNKQKKLREILIDYNLKKISAPFITTPNKKKYTLVLDLDETLVNVTENGGPCKNLESNYKYSLRPGLFSFLNGVQKYYEIISFTNASKEYADAIIKHIETNKKYFDYNFYREHSVLYNNEFIKDISRIGRDMSKIIIVDNVAANLRLNQENGILILPYYSDKSKNDTKLFYLKNMLIKFYNIGYEDLRVALKDYANEIKNSISLDNQLI